MKLTRNLLAILTLASLTIASAEDSGMGAKQPGAVAAESKEMKDCGECKDCAKGAKKTLFQKARDTGPDTADPTPN